MGLITEYFDWVDAEAVDYAESAFQTFSSPLSSLLEAAAVFGLVIIAANSLFQYRSINYSTYSNYILKFLIIYSFLLYYENFELLYTIIVQLPLEYSIGLFNSSFSDLASLESSEFFDASKIQCSGGADDCNRVWPAMDEFANAMFSIGDNLIGQFSFLRFNLEVVLMGLLIYIMGVIFVAGAVIILVVSYLGLAVMAALAPLAISLLLFEQTKGYFDNWIKMMVSFALIPLLLTSLMTAVISMGVGQLPGVDGSASTIFEPKTILGNARTLDEYDHISRHYSRSPRKEYVTKNRQIASIEDDLISVPSAVPRSLTDGVRIAGFWDDVGGFFEDAGNAIGDFIFGGGGGGGISFADFLKFLIICLAAVVLLFQLPTMGTTLAGVTVSLGAAAMAYAATKSNIGGGMSRMREGVASARDASKGGASAGAIAKSAINGMALSAGSRKHRRDQRKMDNISSKDRNNNKAYNSALPESQRSASAQNSFDTQRKATEPNNKPYGPPTKAEHDAAQAKNMMQLKRRRLLLGI